MPTETKDELLPVSGGINKRLKDMGDGTYAEVVAIAGGGAGSDREIVVSTYRCKTAFAGASVGDTITATQIIDVSGDTPSTVSAIWCNQTTATDLASAPSAANIELVGSAALTDAQLRATKVEVQDKSGWASEAVTGRTRDNTKDLVTTYGDGTSETLYFTTAGEYAGKSARA